MQKIAYFPAMSCNANPTPINKSPVLKIDKKRTFDPSLGGFRHTARLSLDPWDLLRIIQEANRIGLDGHKVEGFGYMQPEESVTLSFRRPPKKSN